MFGLSLPAFSLSRPAADQRRRPGRLRAEVKPPSLRCEPTSGWERMKYWVLAPAPLDASPPLSQLPAVRKDFLACLSGTSGSEVERLNIRIERARSLRELWHLRAAMFGLLARLLSQSEAQRRLNALNHHFDGQPRKASAAARIAAGV